MNAAQRMLHEFDEQLLTVPDVLSAAESAALLRRAEGAGFRPAPIGEVVMAPEVRNNGRVMIDDTALAAALWERLAPHAPARWGFWDAVGLNERFRFYRYDVGQYFKWHGDGSFVRSISERSLFTAMIYLNDDFQGGTTDFRDGRSIVPRAGAALLFEHPLIHQGAPVTRGRKYVIRTDVMYRRHQERA